MEDSVKPFVSWNFSVHFSECYMLPDTAALFNRLRREKWEREGQENVGVLLPVKNQDFNF
jgi:hypothetical protein